jgi:hypothetical protein
MFIPALGNKRKESAVPLGFRAAGVEEAEGFGCERGHGFEAGDGVVEANLPRFGEGHFVCLAGSYADEPVMC